MSAWRSLLLRFFLILSIAAALLVSARLMGLAERLRRETVPPVLHATMWKGHERPLK